MRGKKKKPAAAKKKGAAKSKKEYKPKKDSAAYQKASAMRSDRTDGNATEPKNYDVRTTFNEVNDRVGEDGRVKQVYITFWISDWYWAGHPEGYSCYWLDTAADRCHVEVPDHMY